MLQKIKEFIASTNNQIQAMAPPVVPEVVKSAEVKIVDKFEVYIKEQEQNPNVPKKVIYHLKEMLTLSRQINFDDMTLENQSLVRRLLESEVKIMLEVYLCLPQAHAVSVILENGKTAKSTLVENTQKLYSQINQIWVESVNQKTEMLLKREKVSHIKERKKDFFDL